MPFDAPAIRGARDQVRAQVDGGGVGVTADDLAWCLSALITNSSTDSLSVVAARLQRDEAMAHLDVVDGTVRPLDRPVGATMFDATSKEKGIACCLVGVVP